MTEIFTLMMIFLKGLVKHGATQLFSQIDKLDTVICNALVGLLALFVPNI